MSKTPKLKYLFEQKSHHKFFDVLNGVNYSTYYCNTIISQENEEYANLYYKEFNEKVTNYCYIKSFFLNNIKTHNLNIFEESDKVKIDTIDFNNSIIDDFETNLEINKIIFNKKCDIKIFRSIIDSNRKIFINKPIEYFKEKEDHFQRVFNIERVIYQLPKIPIFLKVDFLEIDFSQELIDFIDENIPNLATISCYNCSKNGKRYEYKVLIERKVESYDLNNDLDFF